MISLIQNFTDTHFQLPVFGQRVLIAYEPVTDDNYAIFQMALCSALANTGALDGGSKIAWLSAVEREGQRGDPTWKQPESFKSKASRMVQRLPEPYIHSASTVEDIAELFDTEGFDWSLQGQVALHVTENRSTLPRDSVINFLLNRDEKTFSEIWDSGVSGALLPGVDGAVAAFYAPDERHLAAFIASISRHLQDHNIPFTSSDANRRHTS